MEHDLYLETGAREGEISLYPPHPQRFSFIRVRVSTKEMQHETVQRKFEVLRNELCFRRVMRGLNGVVSTDMGYVFNDDI